MPPVLNAERARIFRITHRDNIPWILKYGLHTATSGILDPNFKAIGNPDLIGKRAQRIVEVDPGGTLSDYIPFYFTPFSIMMLNIHTGYNVKQVPNEEIVILVSSLHRVAELGIQFVFTDQHAHPVTANYFTELDDLIHVPWALLNRRDFKHDPDDPGKKERYQAEALIWRHLPVAALIGICSYTEDVDTGIKTELAKCKIEMQTTVQRGWYFYK